MRDLLLKEIMVTKVFAARMDESLNEVEAKFRHHGIRHLPVVDDKKRVVGMFTLRDLLRCVSPRKTEEGDVFDREQLNRFILKYVMSKDPVVLGPEDTLGHVVDIMVRDKFGCVPIVSPGGVLLGIVTQIDVLKCLARSLRGR
jgi:CBS-domain-containing membrane protein